MSNVWLAIATIFAFIAVWGSVILFIPKHGVIVYNCSLAEISPDYPIEVKQKCREASSGRI
jgi:hypothetical protein